MVDKRFIFTVTTGRTGTGFVANLLGIFKGTTTFHEPDPSFNLVLRAAQDNPQVARDFLVDLKIPAICRMSVSPVYIETSHLFCKGFLEPWLEISELPIPDLIFLDRDFRKISLSNLSLRSIPGKSETGLKFYLAPWDKSCFTRVTDWESLNDYQLCYWYCLEIEERKKLYSQLIQAKGGRTLFTSIEHLQTVNGILEAQKSLELQPLTVHGWLAYFKRRSVNINKKEHAKEDVAFDPHQLDQWEAEVRQRTTVIR